MIRQKILGIISALVFMIAATSASTASWFIFFQPKVPKSLLK